MTSHTRTLQHAVALAAMLILPACVGPLDPDATHLFALSRVSRSEAGPSAVEVPFRAQFFTAGEGLAPDPACDPPRLLNTQVGEGQATHLGQFSIRITFCMDVSDLQDDGQLTEGESLPYEGGTGTLVAANGDELHIEISGAVVPSDHPDFDFEFQDPFVFTGGTGRFAGASGEGITDSFVIQADRTTHDWTGTLVLPRGR